MIMQAGDTFKAIIRKSNLSLTLGGVEAAGRTIGPFVATKVSSLSVETENRYFASHYFTIIKVEEDGEKN